jgi:sulfite reductase (ferredoxin)
MTKPTWREVLADRMPAPWRDEIDVFEREMQLRSAGKFEEKLFAETRLRRGVYGQRYDNGQRHDGVKTRTLEFPCGTLTKGPETVWDAPGMVRIKIPFGAMTAEQIDTIAALSEEYSDGISHVTTRQDIQLHFVHIADTPDLMRRLAAVGITTREACGNSVRNVTACPRAGVCNDQSFDVSPYAQAMFLFLLGHPDVQDFGRKFKIALSGCKDHPCGLTGLHDLGLIAVRRVVDGKEQRGFEMVVGGGLGSVPHQAKLLGEFVPEDEILPTTQAVARVFARLGEKANRSRARIKFLVQKVGIDEFRRLVQEERKTLREDTRWTSYVKDAHAWQDKPHKPGRALPAGDHGAAFAAWRATNVLPQAQAGYVLATVTCPLGDLTADQMRALAGISRRYGGNNVRCTVDQNVVFRWLPEADLPEFFAELQELGLALPGANTITDVTACPGTDTCKLGISSSRGLAAELHERLFAIREQLPKEVHQLKIKASGCFNSCGQHHIADLGFLGVQRKVGQHRMPHFQIVLGGQMEQNASSYGLAIGAVPSKRVPEVVKRITDHYVAHKQAGETFQAFIKRVGKAQIRALFQDLMDEIPSYEQEPDLYTDWADSRAYTTGDLGTGECAGEIVPVAQFGLAASERIAFDAQIRLDEGQPLEAAQAAYRAMIEAAKALTRERNLNLGDDPNEIVSEFKKHLVDTALFRDKYAGDKFAHYLFRVHGNGFTVDAEEANKRVQEATLFIDAAHQCYERMGQAPAPT